jgi:nucleoside triphosphatase
MSDEPFRWDQKFPRVTVGAFIFNKQGQLLLCQSPKWEDYWVVCGGHIDLGETIAHAVEREVKEEVGLETRFVRVIEPIDFIRNPHFHKPYHFVGLQCECRVVGSKQAPTIDQYEISQAKWFTLKEAHELPKVLDETRATINKILKEKYD